MRPITRRQALAELLAGGAVVLAGGSGGGPGGAVPASTGSTLPSTWRDAAGVGMLTRGPGEPLLARTELGPPHRAVRILATLAHVTDAHVLDASSPARVTFL